MKITRQWCEEVFHRVAVEGPLPIHYTSVAYAFGWVRSNVEDYKGFIENHVITPHRQYINNQTEGYRGILRQEYLPYNLLLHIWDKPRGYNGDGDLLQKMYDCYKLPDANPYVKTRWDHFICARPEMLAVQHRQIMFMEHLALFIKDGARSFVDLGCGTGLYTTYAYHQLMQVSVMGEVVGPVIGVDNDIHLTEGGPLWMKMNVLKELPAYQCDIAYSGGLFDYFTDKTFEVMLDRLQVFKPKFIMIGNLCQSAQTKAIMECLGWRIFDRTRWDLLDLAIPHFPPSCDLRVETDITGHQHFIVVKL